ncbi:hypothetical protein [Saccharothrix sp. HUAS TT1]|uniref:hypothetical protein n=1 Tax=unclassified Saccharothrix TaxID=2593673 RepID=UPI00345B8F8B
MPDSRMSEAIASARAIAPSSAPVNYDTDPAASAAKRQAAVEAEVEESKARGTGNPTT